MSHVVHCGNSLEVLATLPESSVDSVVTDPPYELGFMGRSWDASGIANNVDLWRAVLRVLKPGGHLLAFSATRTYHRMACAIEDAGFEVRDQIAWTYGSGFPKSMNVSAAIDKAHDRDPSTGEFTMRAPIISPEVYDLTDGIRAARDTAGVTNKQIDAIFGTNGMAGHWTASRSNSQPHVPNWEEWGKIKALVKAPDSLDELVWRLNGYKGERRLPGDAWNERPITGEHEKPAAGQTWNANYGQSADLSAKSRRDDPVTEHAKKWVGWGTALKPAWEPIVLARKPMPGTVSQNVIAHGTGALNVDGCRIAAEVEECRWPANLTHDGSAEVVAMFPAEAGGEATADTGSAARFFYCAKASRADRDEGLEAFASIGGGEITGREEGAAGAKAEAFAGTTETGRKNIHPTVKPTALMRWLIRLITQGGGVVLDPFNGSGSTGKAAVLEGMRYIGIDLSPEYVAIAKARISHAEANREELTREHALPGDPIVPISKPADAAQLDLFSAA